MNWYFIIAGSFTILTGFVHMILGELWIFSKLKPENLETHYSGEITKTTLRWFWHVGSFIVFLVGTMSLLMGFTDRIITDEHQMGELLSLIYLGINGLLIGLHITNPKKLKAYPQILIMLVIMVLLFLGAHN